MKRVRLTALLRASATLGARTPIPAPQDHVGVALGDDYQLATYGRTANKTTP